MLIKRPCFFVPQILHKKPIFYQIPTNDLSSKHYPAEKSFNDKAWNFYNTNRRYSVTEEVIMSCQTSGYGHSGRTHISNQEGNIKKFCRASFLLFILEWVGMGSFFLVKWSSKAGLSIFLVRDKCFTGTALTFTG